MDVEYTKDNVKAQLSQYADPIGATRERLYNLGLGVADFKNSELYITLTTLKPLKIEKKYHGDANEFMTAEVHDEYVPLRNLIVEIGTALQVWPYEGEPITQYVDRIITDAINYILEEPRE